MHKSLCDEEFQSENLEHVCRMRRKSSGRNEGVLGEEF